MAPNANTSARGSASRPRTCSGALYPMVPMTAPAVEQLGDDVRGPVVRADVMDRDDVGMIQGSGGARLLLEAEHVAGVVVARRQHLERDVPIELQVVGHEDAAHSAATQLALDPVPIAEQLHRCSRRQAAPAEGVRQWARPKSEGADQVSFRAPRPPLSAADTAPPDVREE